PLKGFLWCNEELSRGKAKIAWKKFCRPKSHGGLGLKDLEIWNKALLVKHIWNLAAKKDTLWVKWFSTVKLNGKNFWEVNADVNDSWGWKNLLLIRNEVAKNIWYKLGNGEKTLIWFENWCEMGPLFKFILNRSMYSARLSRDLMVADMVSNGKWKWLENWGTEYPRIKQINDLALIEGKEDWIVWKNKDNKECKFSTKETFNGLASNNLESPGILADSGDSYKHYLLVSFDMINHRFQVIDIPDLVMRDVIENGNSFKPVARTTANADGTSTSTIPGPVTTEEKARKKNDDVKTLFAAIHARFGGNDATKKTQKTLLKQIQLAILGENISPEDLNLKFLRSLPAEWNTYVVVWRNKPDLDTMRFDDLYNNFKIVKQEVKRTVTSSSNSSSQNMAFVSSPSNTNDVNTANVQVSAASTPVSTASTTNKTANLSDATVYAFLANQPNDSQLVHEDLEQIHKDDLEEMDLKCQLALLSMRARRYYQRTGKKIIINGSDTAGYDKSKVECFNCHKIGHFSRECRSPRNQDCDNHDLSRFDNQSIKRDRLIVIGFVLDFVEFISFTFSDKEMILVIEAVNCRTLKKCVNELVNDGHGVGVTHEDDNDEHESEDDNDDIESEINNDDEADDQEMSDGEPKSIMTEMILFNPNLSPYKMQDDPGKRKRRRKSK
ncbi:putative ribonuclease H-like domain-containing protein, partial [Tanacetum coccineum]